MQKTVEIYRWRFLSFSSSTECAPLGVNRDRYPQVFQCSWTRLLASPGCATTGARGCSSLRRSSMCQWSCRVALRRGVHGGFWDNFPYSTCSRCVQFALRNPGIISTSCTWLSLPVVFMPPVTEAFGRISGCFHVKVDSEFPARFAHGNLDIISTSSFL